MTITAGQKDFTELNREIRACEDADITIENAMGQAVQVARSGIIRDIEEKEAMMNVERE